MARFNADTADKYGGQGGAGYFSLKNDKDTAQVRFMYNGIEDVEGYAVHTVEIDDKKRYVNCLREYNEPVDKCPFCKAKMPTSAKLFIPIYNVDEGKMQFWERGKKFVSKISSICARYPHVVSHIFEIERNGKKGDTSTTYEIYEVSQDETTLEDLPEVNSPLGTVVLDKSADDMEFFTENGYFPPDDDEVPIRRRNSASDDEDDSSEDRRTTRRTPTTTRRGDRF